MINEDYQLEILSDSSISAVGRARVSEGSPDEIQNSLNSQKDGTRELAKRLNVGKIYWYIGLEAVSAFKLGGDTELFKQARAFACSNKDVKYFLQWDQTRFSRDRHSSQNFKRELIKNGVEVRFCHGDIADKTSGGAIILDAVQEALAEADGVEKGQFVLSRCLTNAKTRDEATGWCFKNGGSPPYGYKRHRIEVGKKRNGDLLLKTVWIENDEVVTCNINGKPVSKTVASWAQYILIDLRLNQGLSMDKIRDHLNEIGLPAPRKKYWSDSTVCEITQNIAYIGKSIYNKHNWSSYRRGMGLKIKDTKEYVIEEDSHPALITEEQYQMLKNMAKPSNKSTRAKRKQLSESSYLLTPYSICKSCNGTIIGKNRRYRCATYDRKGAKVCGAPLYTVKQSWIEEEVIKVIGLVFDNNILERTISEILKFYIPKVNKNEIEALKRKIEIDERAKLNLLNTLQTVDSEPYATQAMVSRLEELEKSISSCKSELSRIIRPVAIPSKDTLKNRLVNIINFFEKSNYEQKRVILQTFIKQIEFDPFNKCITVEGYCDPLSAWKHIDKLKEKAPELAGASNLLYFEHGCGGKI